MALQPVTDLSERDYVHPAVLVTTEWVAAHLHDPGVRIVESNEDPLLYLSGHIPGAVEVDWTTDLNDPLSRDYIDENGFQTLLRRIGVDENITIVFYGDKNNWWACYAFWVFQLFGFTNTRVMDGGRLKWEKEGRELTRELPSYPPTTYTAQKRTDGGVRAFRDEVLAHVRSGGQLVDVRSPAEFTGERLHMPDYPNEGALRGGHIPGAKNVPWGRAINPEDGTFLAASDLRKIYEGELGFDPSQATVAYCRIGERSSHTWFVLNYLLGFEDVRNYDGSWTEWGNSVGLPVEK
jgi:thiosulfate/3-mercaptopyruvate sulfurtransferase